MRTFPAIQERHDLVLILERFQIFVLLVKKLTEVGHLSHLRPRVDGTELYFKYLHNVELELARSILGGCNIFDRTFPRNEDFPTLHWEHIYWTQTLFCYRIQNTYRLFIKTEILYSVFYKNDSLFPINFTLCSKRNTIRFSLCNDFRFCFILEKKSRTWTIFNFKNFQFHSPIALL